jgi:[acyl-carrier-protein] S-malonyltransferase
VLTGMAKRTLDGVRTISVATPDELDRLLAWIGGEPATQNASAEGEHLFASERLVVSPAAGVFATAGIADGTTISVGTILGHVGDVEVRSPFAGILQSYIAVDTERLAPRQPIAWLRTA